MIQELKKARGKVHRNRIKEILESKEMTQQELSDITNINPSYLSKIIQGKKRCISLPTAIKICKALKTPVEEVFVDKNNEKESEINAD